MKERTVYLVKTNNDGMIAVAGSKTKAYEIAKDYFEGKKMFLYAEGSSKVANRSNIVNALSIERWVTVVCGNSELDIDAWEVE